MMRAYVFAAALVAAFSCLMTDGALAQSLGHRYWWFNFEYSNGPGPAGIDVAEADFLAGGIDKAVGGIAVASSSYPGNTPSKPRICERDCLPRPANRSFSSGRCSLAVKGAPAFSRCARGNRPTT